ncbi:MAG: AzlD domain-containing protein [Longicatena sp.]|nr:AzlD domain-containing protein [Longicatena sp.]
MLQYIPYVLVMALITYLIRALPLMFFRKEITNIYIKSFLYYVPYAVLSAMTFPAIFFVSQSILVSSIATIVALILAYRGKSLLTVALVACVVLWFCDFMM